MTEEPEEVKATVFGTPIAVKGVTMLIVVVLAVALGGLIYFMVTGNQAEHLQQTGQQTREHQNLVETLKSINETNQKIGELVDEQNYIVLSDEKERKAMKDKLRRPSSLSKKLKGESE
jgi:flagellar basal body-associated protein FliL